MIFFLTTITPSSNVEVNIEEAKKGLFESGILIPLPFTICPVDISRSKPIRPSRKEISDKLPSVVNPGKLISDRDHLVLSIENEIPCSIDSALKDSVFLIPGAIDFGPLTYSDMKAEGIDSYDFPSFKNYSLSAYEIHCENPSSWWSNMSWIKLWEVKKSKTYPDVVS